MHVSEWPFQKAAGSGRARKATTKISGRLFDTATASIRPIRWRSDIIREQETGKLYVLEINPGGNTWVFSRENTANVIAELGGYDIRQQFNAFETIADALIERTRLEAE